MRQHIHFIVVPVAASVLLLSLAGCGDSGPARGPITGTVTLGGQPLKLGRIMFTPVEPNEGPAVSAPVVDGRYTLARAAGPVAGKNRVEVDSDLAASLGFALEDEEAFAKRGNVKLPPDPIPPTFNRQSTLTVEVAADRENTYNVEIPARRFATHRARY
jgi:hypothetical protein